MENYALVNADGLVVNLIAWDGVIYNERTAPRGWAPPPGFSAVPDPDRKAVVGGTYLNGTFSDG